MVENPGDGADGNLSGTIDAFSRLRVLERPFRPNGGVAAPPRPQPTTIALLFGGLMLAARRQSRSVIELRHSTRAGQTFIFHKAQWEKLR